MDLEQLEALRAEHLKRRRDAGLDKLPPAPEGAPTSRELISAHAPKGGEQVVMSDQGLRRKLGLDGGR